ncbi:taurine catabolism dioxygenase TauD [Cystobacter fuscus]|uniref:Taurine catabolism dioxygenase TauD n=1 Tax=Cystobacter fuscus TaxID=43 RepID=A0A250J5K4_9BACT|nr:TauD/TfdA family dioxygenase [Cystobacter fuscus]ATB38797.1 taurine catabolism dioxygenase TauD [Cystobacter fuscus]
MMASTTATPPGIWPGRVLEGPAAWRGADLARNETWIHRFSSGELAELDRALAGVRGLPRPVLDVTRDNFVLPTLAPTLARVKHELLHGRGFILFRGLPTQRYSLPELATLFWGLGTYLGTAVSQNAQGHVLGHVKDLGYDANNPSTRLYQTNQRQGYHTDSADIVGLLCVRTAMRGGLSSLASTVTVYNEMYRRRPDLSRVLFEPFHTDHRSEYKPGHKPYFSIPVLNFHAGELTGIYQRRYIESAQRFEDSPRLTPQQVEALDLFDSLLDDPALHLEMRLEPGDMQFIHNHQILHDRTAFEDWPEPERRRHLLRLWLCPPDGRPLPPIFTERYGSVEVGRRGGVHVPASEFKAPLDV